MSTHKGLALHRAVVQSVDTVSGVCLVYLPALIGTQVVSVPPTGLNVVDGQYQLPSVGDDLMVAVDTAGSSFHWVVSPPSGGGVTAASPRGVVGMAVAQSTYSLPSGSAIPGAALRFDAEALRRYRISCQGYLGGTAGDFVTGTIRDSANAIVGQWAGFDVPDVATQPYTAQSGFYLYTAPATGAVTFKMYVESNAGNPVTVYSTSARPSSIVIEDIGTVPDPFTRPTWGGVKWGQTHWSINPANWSEALWGQATWQ